MAIWNSGSRTLFCSLKNGSLGLWKPPIKVWVLKAVFFFLGKLQYGKKYYRYPLFIVGRLKLVWQMDSCHKAQMMTACFGGEACLVPGDVWHLTSHRQAHPCHNDVFRIVSRTVGPELNEQQGNLDFSAAGSSWYGEALALDRGAVWRRGLDIAWKKYFLNKMFYLLWVLLEN